METLTESIRRTELEARRLFEERNPEAFDYARAALARRRFRLIENRSVLGASHAEHVADIYEDSARMYEALQ